MSDASQRTDFEEIAEKYAHELRMGKHPEINVYASRYPALAAQIERLFPVLAMMEQRGQIAEDLSEEGLLEAEMRQLRTTPPLKTLGDYRIIREIGRGGMGIVFEAQQESLGRRVALKVLPQSAQFDERRRLRFEHEARASAMLHHSNIVPIFGVGHENDTSYFVMQYIEGHALDSVLHELSKLNSGSGLRKTRADAGRDGILSTVVSRFLQAESRSLEQSLEQQSDIAHVADSTITRAERLDSPDMETAVSGQHQMSGVNSLPAESDYWRKVAKIGIQVASGLEYAHSKEILHRDIKPANLLLDQSGCVWITDFGLAKHFESPDLTRTGELVGTLRYMSPEQLSGGSDERSDIFAMGLTLYEMACLQPAYPATSRSQLLQQVAEAAPRPLRLLDRRIPLDLETIIHKCLAVDPKNRYQSAAELSADLQRFLNGQAIYARRTSSRERMLKWCRRRPAVAALLAALTFALGLGIGGTAWQLQQTVRALALAKENLTESDRQKLMAQEHFQQAREAVSRFFTVVSQQRLLQEPGFQPLRKDLLQEAKNYHVKFVAQYKDNDELKFELGKSLFQIAEIESSLRRDPAIAAMLDEPIRIFSELSNEVPDDPQNRLWLARGLGLQSNVLGSSSGARSLELILKSIAELEVLRADFPEFELGQSDLAQLYQTLGLIYEVQDRAGPQSNRSLNCYLQSFELRSQLVDTYPDKMELAIDLGEIHRDLGIAYRRMRDYEQAEKHYGIAMEILGPLVENNPDNMMAKKTLASVANSIGYYYSTGAVAKDLQMALRYHEISKTQYQELAEQNPQIIEFQDGVARAANNAGSVYQSMQDLENAYINRKLAEEIRGKLTLLNPNSGGLLSNWALSLNGVGATLRDMGRLDESLETHWLAHKQHCIALEKDNNPNIRIALLNGLIQVVRTYSAQQNFGEAIKTIESLSDFKVENFSKVYYWQGRELVIIASKLGDLAAEDQTEQTQAYRKNCIEGSKSAFQKAIESDFDVQQELIADPVYGYFSVFPEFQSILSWLAE